MKTFGHTRPVRNEAGDITGSKPSPVRVRTIEGLSPSYGTDKHKRLILTCHPQDLIGIRPERTSRELTITVVDLYAELLRRAANFAHLSKARERKAKRAERLARERQARAERKLFTKPSKVPAEALRRL